METDHQTLHGKLQFFKRIGFLTNIPPDELPIYERAIEEFKRIQPHVILTIGEPYKQEGHSGLYCPSEDDLTEFWLIKNLIAKLAF